MGVMSGTIDLGTGIVVSDQQVAAMGQDPNALRAALGQNTTQSGRPFGKANLPGTVAAPSDPCAAYNRLKTGNYPASIVEQLRRKCADAQFSSSLGVAKETAAIAGGSPVNAEPPPAYAEDDPGSGVPRTYLIAGAVAAAAVVAVVFLKKKKRKK